MCNLNDKHLYVVHIKNLQQALNQSKKMKRFIKGLLNLIIFHG